MQAWYNTVSLAVVVVVLVKLLGLGERFAVGSVRV